MGVRVTFGLVILAAVTLILGVAAHIPVIIYLSIACSAVAFVGLVVSTRRNRERAETVDHMAWTASLAEPPVTAAIPVVARRPEARDSANESANDDLFADSREPASREPASRETASREPAEIGARTPRRRSVGTARSASPASAPPSSLSSLPSLSDVRPVATVRSVPAVSPRFAEPDLSFDAPDAANPAFDDDAEPELEPTRATASIRRRPGRMTPAPSAAEVAPAAPGATRLAPRARSPKRNPIASEWVQGDETRSGPVHSTVRVVPAGANAAAAVGPGARPAPAGPARVEPPARTTARGAPVVPAARPDVPAAPAPVPIAAPAPSAGRGKAPLPPVDEYVFPIEDYDYLSVADILPLLPELDDQELFEILLFEQDGANRPVIVNRIDALLEGED